MLIATPPGPPCARTRNLWNPCAVHCRFCHKLFSPLPLLALMRIRPSPGQRSSCHGVGLRLIRWRIQTLFIVFMSVFSVFFHLPEDEAVEVELSPDGSALVPVLVGPGPAERSADKEEEKDTMQPIWELSIPLPAVMIITVSLYMLLLGISFWIRYCLQDKCSADCCDCCPSVSVCEQCFRLAEMCDCSLPTVGSLLPASCPAPSCPRWDCACTCQPPECESCNCLCFEIRIK